MASGFAGAALVALPPPLTVIRLYTGFSSKPAIVTVDPARLSMPTVTAHVESADERLGLP
jgi:hypothetical protein